MKQTVRQRTQTAGEIFLRRLKANGVDYLFANGGTDFAPIIEGYAYAQAEGAALPEALVMPHETAAVAMAHGYYLATGRAQAVMVHTNVGLANTVLGAINAATEQIPMLLCSGRTPVTETGLLGSRTTPINWGQDMKDQNALVRESMKWDFELRDPNETAEMVDRAFAIAKSEPRGPVYLSLPREVLCAPCTRREASDRPLFAPALIAPDAGDVARAAELVRQAKAPLIIGHRGAEREPAFSILKDFAESFAIPVVEYWPSRPSMPTDSPMHAGSQPGEEMAGADLILVLDHLSPWMPHRDALPDGCKVVQIGPDPLHARFPVRGFRSDITLAGSLATVLAALKAALSPELKGAFQSAVAARFKTVAARTRARREAAIARARAGGGASMSAAYVARTLSDVFGTDAAFTSELGVDPYCMDLVKPLSFFATPVSGGLGFGMPAALGVQLADRDRPVAATVGDGSYMFANPVACHQIAEALNLPILTLVMNNGVWNAVRHSTLDIFPDGQASKANRMPITSLEPLPDFVKVAEASRAHAERVESGSDLPAALKRARDIIKNERRQVLLDVRVPFK